MPLMTLACCTIQKMERVVETKVRETVIIDPRSIKAAEMKKTQKTTQEEWRTYLVECC